MCTGLVHDKVNISVSIIIPCFNAATSIGAAIESVHGQANFASNVVIIDDGSNDGSLTIANSFEPRVRIIAESHRGVSAARNRGIAETKGEWIVFLDADDLLNSGTLRRRLEAAEATGADVVVCDWQEFLGGRDGTVDGAARSLDLAALEADAELACATHVWASTAALMYRRSLVQKIGGFREDLPVIQDARFLFDAAYHGARFAHSPHLGARHRISPQSLSRRDPARFWRDCLLNGTQIEALWRAGGTLTSGRISALADIYNGAAHGLFRASDPSFRQALAALRTSGMPVSRRNRLAELLSDVAGHRRAVRLAQRWTTSRRLITGLRRRSPRFRSAPGQRA
jgi:glycosyltransferase involved in cell wall biosynthesis